MIEWWNKVQNHAIAVSILILTIVVLAFSGIIRHGETKTFFFIIILWTLALLLSSLTMRLYTKYEFKEREAAIIYLATVLLLGLSVLGIYFTQ